MDIQCIWEHNGPDTLLYAQDHPGAFTRGANLEEAMAKMPQEIASWLRWAGEPPVLPTRCIIVQEKLSELMIRDADSDVLFDSERLPLTRAEYERLKALAMRSAYGFQQLYDSIPDRSVSCLQARKTFYSQIPRTAQEMYDHTKSVNDYYFGEICTAADHSGGIAECRSRGFDALEQQEGFLQNKVFEGSYGEAWTLRKVLRRFIWHDRIHAKAMRRMALHTFPGVKPADPFYFE